MNNGTQQWLHIGIGSGYRAHPNKETTYDRFYSLREYQPFQQLTQTEFNNLPIITESDLTDVTNDVDASLANDSDGWMIKLASGEKVLAGARTFNNDIYFTTFTPGARRMLTTACPASAPTSSTSSACSTALPSQTSIRRSAVAAAVRPAPI